MDAEIKKLWQDALLSGDYKQGAGNCVNYAKSKKKQIKLIHPNKTYKIDGI
jgi:hypothetical protein